MSTIFCLVFSLLRTHFVPGLHAEILALHHQLLVLQRSPMTDGGDIRRKPQSSHRAIRASCRNDVSWLTTTSTFAIACSNQSLDRRASGLSVILVLTCETTS
jgi:hypothetical protein